MHIGNRDLSKSIDRNNTHSNTESLALDKADKEQQQEMHRYIANQTKVLYSYSQSNPIKQRFWIVTANQIQLN